MNRIKDLQIIAKQQISICCETLCERASVEEYIEWLELEIKDLRKYVEALEEAVQRIVDDPLSVCPECNEEELKKVIVAGGSGFQLKGKGWFKSGGY
mgnify:CR=1 FL=1